MIFFHKLLWICCLITAREKQKTHFPTFFFKNVSAYFLMVIKYFPSIRSRHRGWGISPEKKINALLNHENVGESQSMQRKGRPMYQCIYYVSIHLSEVWGQLIFQNLGCLYKIEGFLINKYRMEFMVPS